MFNKKQGRSDTFDSNSGKSGIYLRKRTPKKSFDQSDYRKSSMEQDPEDEDEDSSRRRLLKIMLELFEGKNVSMDQIRPLTLDERQILASLMIRKFSVQVQ